MIQIISLPLKNIHVNTKIINWVILIALALTWGSSFILMKRGMDVYSSDEVAALRIFIAFVFLSPLIFKHVKKPLLKHWKGFLGMGSTPNRERRSNGSCGMGSVTGANLSGYPSQFDNDYYAQV